MSSKESLHLASTATCATHRRLLLSLKIQTIMDRQARAIEYALTPTLSYAAAISTFTTALAGTKFAVILNLSAARMERTAMVTLLTQPNQLITVMVVATRRSMETIAVRTRHMSLR